MNAPRLNTPDPVAEWHRILEDRDIAALASLLHDDAVFLSPVVHTPQRGKRLVMGYLGAAAAAPRYPITNRLPRCGVCTTGDRNTASSCNNDASAAMSRSSRMRCHSATGSGVFSRGAFMCRRVTHAAPRDAAASSIATRTRLR